jgi:hypothetical protein
VVEEGVRGMSVMDGTEQLAWVVLHSANRTQSRGSTARLVVPRAPEAADELGRELTDAQLRSVEEFLLDHGYVADADIGLTWSAYTVTPAGLKWLETGLSEPLLPDRVRELAERPGEEEALPPAPGRSSCGPGAPPQDEGNAYARLGEVLGRLGREDEARAAYEAGIRQAEKFGHSGMAEDLRVALIQLRE